MIFYSIRLNFTFLIGLLGGSFGTFASGQRFLRSHNNSSSSHGGLGEILTISLLDNGGLQLVQSPSGTGLHGHNGLARSRFVRISSLDGNREPFEVRSVVNSNGLFVDKTSVALGMLVGQVHGVGGKGLGAAALFQQKGGVVAGDGPGDIRRHDDLEILKILRKFVVFSNIFCDF